MTNEIETFYNIAGYNMFTNNNQSNKGGVALYIKNSTPVMVKPAQTFIRNGIETIFADLNTPGGIKTIFADLNTPGGIKTIFADLNTPGGIKTIFADRNTPSGIITVGLVYKRSVDISTENFSIALEEIISCLDPNIKTYIFMGDFNINLLDYSTSPTYPEWPHKQGGCLACCGCTFQSRRGCSDLYYARGAQGVLPMRVRVRPVNWIYRL